MTDRLEGFYSGPARTLTPREAAALRPGFLAPLPKPRAKPVLREVTSGIVCFCGERFGETQALEFMLHLRAEVGEHLDRVERKRAYYRERGRRNNADADKAARIKENARAARKLRMQDPEYAERERARCREKERRRREARKGAVA